MYVQPLSSSERDRYYAEGVPAASLYGASGAPTSEIELEMLLHAMAGRLERSDIVFEFLTIMRSAAILPLLLRPAQDLLVRAGVDLTPNWVRTILGLNGHGLHPWEAEVIRHRSFRRPRRSGVQPSRSGLSAGAPSGRLLVCPPQRSRVSTGPLQQVRKSPILFEGTDTRSGSQACRCAATRPAS